MPHEHKRFCVCFRSPFPRCRYHSSDQTPQWTQCVQYKHNFMRINGWSGATSMILPGELCVLWSTCIYFRVAGCHILLDDFDNWGIDYFHQQSSFIYRFANSSKITNHFRSGCHCTPLSPPLPPTDRAPLQSVHCGTTAPHLALSMVNIWLIDMSLYFVFGTLVICVCACVRARYHWKCLSVRIEAIVVKCFVVKLLGNH